jgi:hypothetical protein
MPKHDGPTALYRYFDDEGRLLYAGITGNHWLRTLNHASKSGWMELAVSSTIARYPGRREALEAEYSAIRGERPLFNWQHNDTAEALARLRAYLTEIGRMDLFVPRVPGTGGGGEVGQAKNQESTSGCGIDKPHGPCLDDDEVGYVHYVRVDHALDYHGKPVSAPGMVIMHVYDGTECIEVYLRAQEAREIAAALAGHADESVTVKTEGESRLPSSAIAGDELGRKAPRWYLDARLASIEPVCVPCWSLKSDCQCGAA